MSHMRTCCCCTSVRNGSFISATWSLVYSVVHVLILAECVNNQNNEAQSDKVNSSLNVTTTEEGGEEVIGSVINPEGFLKSDLQYINLTLLTLFTAVAISCILVFAALCKDSPTLLLPWIGATLVTTSTEMIIAVYILALETTIFEPKTAFIFTLESFIFALQGYTLLCVYSQYKEYKAGRGFAKQHIDWSFGPLNGVKFEPPTQTGVSTRMSLLERTAHRGPQARTPNIIINRNRKPLENIQEGESSSKFREELPCPIDGVEPVVKIAVIGVEENSNSSGKGDSLNSPLTTHSNIIDMYNSDNDANVDTSEEAHCDDSETAKKFKIKVKFVDINGYIENNVSETNV